MFKVVVVVASVAKTVSTIDYPQRVAFEWKLNVKIISFFPPFPLDRY